MIKIPHVGFRRTLNENPYLLPTLVRTQCLKTILVTKITGTAGSALVSQLADHDVTVRGAVHSLDSAGNVTDTADETVEIDMTDPETLSPAFDGIDRA